MVAGTILSSMDKEDLISLRMNPELVDRTVLEWEKNAMGGCALDGVMRSPLEVAILRRRFPEYGLIMATGISTPEVEAEECKRVGSPQFAMDAGANWIIIDSAIRKTHDPIRAAKAINESLFAKKHPSSSSQKIIV